MLTIVFPDLGGPEYFATHPPVCSHSYTQVAASEPETLFFFPLRPFFGDFFALTKIKLPKFSAYGPLTKIKQPKISPYGPLTTFFGIFFPLRVFCPYGIFG